MTTTDATIGERVHGLMWRQRVSQTDMADRLGIAQPTLSRKLRGERPWFADELQRAAEALEVSVGSLFGEPTLVRPKGLEPPTFWTVVCDAATWGLAA